MKTTCTLVALLLGLSFLGCLESNPQPMPEDEIFNGPPGGDDAAVEPTTAKSVDNELIFASAPDESGQMVIVGAEGAAAGADAAYAGGGEDNSEPSGGTGEDATEDTSGDSKEDGDGFSVAGDGSFVIVIPNVKPPKILLTFHYPETDEDVVVEVAVPDPASDSDARPWMDAGEEKQGDPGFNEPPAEYDAMAGGIGAGVSALLIGDGVVEVIGTPFAVTPLSTVVIANLTTGDKVLAQANTVGEFAVQLPGKAGDLVSVFVVNPSDHSEATAALVLTVPAQ